VVGVADATVPGARTRVRGARPQDAIRVVVDDAGSGAVTLEVYDVTGRRVEAVVAGPATTELAWTPSRSATGVRFLRVVTAEWTATHRIAVVP
jgi:hypothetical protein